MSGADSLSFYYHQLLSNQMLAAIVLKASIGFHLPKTVRPFAPCGVRCMGHAVTMWSVVCSVTQHVRSAEGARSYLLKDELNHLTPVPRRLTLIQAVGGKLILTNLILVIGIKAQNLNVLLQYSVFYL